MRQGGVPARKGRGRLRLVAALPALLALLVAGLPAQAARPAPGPESLAGSFVAFAPEAGGDSCYAEGTAQTFCFRAESYTDDYEWATDVWIRFPAGWSVTDVTVLGTPTCDQGGTWGPFSWSFQTAPHEVRISHERDHAWTDHCSAVYCFEVTSGAGTPYALESWYWSGDGWGDPPNNPCSSDGYAPPGQPPCDEPVQPPASIPPCTWPPGLYLEPAVALLQGCNGVAQPASFNLTNRTGAAGTFALAYSVPSGNGSLAGAAALSLADGETAALELEMTPDLCAAPGDAVEGLVEVSGNGYSTTAALEETVVAGTWSLLEPHPLPTSSWAVVSATDSSDGLEYLYVFGSTRQRIYRYDPRSGVWAALALLPGRLHEAGDAVAYNGHLYARTDGQGMVTQSLFDYDIAADSWSATAVPAQHVDRSLYEAVELGGWIYFIGGWDLSATSNQVDRYNPATATWETVAPMLHNRASAASWVYEGRIYVAGGSDEFDDFSSTEVYDPATGTWTEDAGLFAPLPATWTGAADALLHGDQLWLMGGSFEYWETSRTAYWTEADNAWHMGPRLAQIVTQTEGDLLAGQLQVVGGLYGVPTDANQRLTECPSCLLWEKSINGAPWQAGVPVQAQTYDTLTVLETVEGSGFSLEQAWDSARLELTEFGASDGDVVTGDGSLEWHVAYGPAAAHDLMMTFRVLPCTWTATTVSEGLWSSGARVGEKPLSVEKAAPTLWLEALYEAAVVPGELAALTLSYGNSGGYENDAVVRLDLPPDAPFQGALPAPDRSDPAGLWAEWDVGDLAQGAQGSIDVTVFVSGDAQPGPLSATAALLDHTGTSAASATIEWQVGGGTWTDFLPLVLRNP